MRPFSNDYPDSGFSDANQKIGIYSVDIIWILQDAPAGRRNSIAAYDITERVITADNGTGFSAEPVKNYDLLSVVMMSPGDLETKRADQALRMLSTAFSEKLTAAAKKQIPAEEFGIRMTEPVGKVVETMCNLSCGIEKLPEGKIHSGCDSEKLCKTAASVWTAVNRKNEKQSRERCGTVDRKNRLRISRNRFFLMNIMNLCLF